MDNQKMEMWTKMISKATFFIFVIFIMAIIIWKLVGTELKIDLTSFDFKDFLFLIVALFSLLLSIAFYFKATETSNTFYDNTYKFTRDISEILGRIEAGFGEKLQHLDTGYTDLIGKLSPITNKEKQETEKEIVKDKKKLDEIIKEKDKLISDIMEKAELQGHERDLFKQELEKKEKTIADLIAHLHRLEGNLEKDAKEGFMIMERDMVRVIIENYLNKFINVQSRKELYKTFEEIKDNLPDVFIYDLMNYNLINKDRHLTARGIGLFNEIIPLIRRDLKQK